MGELVTERLNYGEGRGHTCAAVPLDVIFRPLSLNFWGRGLNQDIYAEHTSPEQTFIFNLKLLRQYCGYIT